MYEVITIGSALVDIFIHSPEFQIQKTAAGLQLCQTYGDKVEVESLQIFSGGGGGNTAVGFQRLGFQAAVVAELGKDAFADVVFRELAQEKVATELLIKEKKEQTGGSIILVGSDGGRTVMVHRGAASQLDERDVPSKTLAHCHWLHVSSMGGQLAALKKIFTIAREQTIGLSWNPGKAELKLLSDGQLQVADLAVEILFLNQEEWQSISALQTKLQVAVPQIIITNGRQGGQVFLKNKTQFFYQAERVTSVDDTGAGDAFAAAYVSAYLCEKTPPVAVQWGVKNAASVVQHVGAKTGLLSKDKLTAAL